MKYDPEVFCIVVEPLFRVHKALRQRGYANNQTHLIVAAVSGRPGVASFFEYAGTSCVFGSDFRVL
jgi:hypothetical protein